MSVQGGIARRVERSPRPEGATSTERPEPAWGRWVVRVGALMILAGVGVFAWVGWQLYGTNWVSHRTQRQLVEQLETEWAKPAQDGGGPGRSQVVETDHGPSQAIIRIPKFGDDFAIPVIEGTSDDALASGFGHYEATAGPGEVGNYALAGHRITHGEPLRDMPLLVEGDLVEVETSDATYVYRLISGGDDLVVPRSQTWVVDPLPDNPVAGGVEPRRAARQSLITLTSCSELFHTDNRFVAFGVLVRTV